MAEYRKYMFDNFVIDDSVKKEAALPVEDNIITEEEALPPVIEDKTDTAVLEPENENINELSLQQDREPAPVEEPEPKEPSYSREELAAAVKAAEEAAYEKAQNTVIVNETQKQTMLFEDIKNKLSEIFSGLDARSADMEKAALNFAVAAVHKVLPTLEEKQAEAEVKNFLAENFTNFAAQETLSFSFNPDMVSRVADSIGRLAEQNDFEGKIAVHKDPGLGLSDCRVEWKNGGVERNTKKLLNKVDMLINDNMQERENEQ